MKISTTTAAIRQPQRDYFLAQTSWMLAILLVMMSVRQDFPGQLLELLSR